MKKPIITYHQFEKLEIIVGKIINAETIKKSEKLLALEVDLGKEWGTVNIISGIKPWYSPKQLIGNNYLFLANLEPKKLMGFQSHGMILAADNKGKANIINVKKNIPQGTLIR